MFTKYVQKVELGTISRSLQVFFGLLLGLVLKVQLLSMIITLYKAKASRITAVNPVGSGDSVVTGFSAGAFRGLTDQSLIKFGLAIGVLNVLEEETGHVDAGKVEWAVDQIAGERL